jgi:hypothetical protein
MLLPEASARPLSSQTFTLLYADASSIQPDPLLLRPDLAGEWVPAAGGGWRWACVSACAMLHAADRT